MYSPKPAQKRLVIGTWLAALSILANAALHGASAQEILAMGGSGGSFSICLAQGGTIGTTPTDKGDFTGSANDHCDLCVIPACSAVPTSDTGPTTVVFKKSSDVVYGYTASLTASQEQTHSFDARGPPA